MLILNCRFINLSPKQQIPFFHNTKDASSDDCRSVTESAEQCRAIRKFYFSINVHRENFPAKQTCSGHSRAVVWSVSPMCSCFVRNADFRPFNCCLYRNLMRKLVIMCASSIGWKASQVLRTDHHQRSRKSPGYTNFGSSWRVDPVCPLLRRHSLRWVNLVC